LETLYDIRVYSASNEEIEKQWSSLELKSRCTFFLSWQWVKAWLISFSPDVKLLVAKCEEEVVALALVTEKGEVRHGLLRSRVLRFGRTGNPIEDQIWPEYGGILIADGHQDTLPAQLVEYLCRQGGWDEIELAATPDQELEKYQISPLISVEKWSAPSYGVDLDCLSANQQSFSSSLSRNTRYQINRCRKRYLKREQLRFEVLNTFDSIESVWPLMADLHRQRWDHTPEKSGFSNPGFVGFHKRLIEAACTMGLVEVCVLWQGDRFIGGLLNYLYKNRVYFYLSALVQEQDAHLKPGLLLHSYAIEDYLSRGFDFYDFMGGDSQYKRSLGTEHCVLRTLSLQRKSNMLMAERGLRRLKNLWVKN